MNKRAARKTVQVCEELVLKGLLVGHDRDLVGYEMKMKICRQGFLRLSWAKIRVGEPEGQKKKTEEKEKIKRASREKIGDEGRN